MLLIIFATFLCTIRLLLWTCILPASKVELTKWRHILSDRLTLVGVKVHDNAVERVLRVPKPDLSKRHKLIMTSWQVGVSKKAQDRTKKC